MLELVFTAVLVVVLRAGFRLLSWLPLVGLLWFYSFALTAAIKWGHFPTPDVREPTYAAWPVLYSGVAMFAQAIAFGLPLWLMLVGLLREMSIPTRTELVVFLVGWALILIQVFWDPFGVLRWYFD